MKRRPSEGIEAAQEPHVEWALLPTAVHGASLLLAGALTMYFGRRLWFFGDEWDFVTSRRLVGGTHGLLYPHNEHWSTLPILAWRGMESVVGIRSYVPYLAMLVAAHLTLAHLLWRAARRAQADAWIATALVAIFAVLGTGAENLLWAFQIGFVGSLAFGVAAALVSEGSRQRPRWRILAVWALTLGALGCSGVGLSMLGVVLWVSWRRRGLISATADTGIPLLLYVLWYANFGRGHSGAPPPRKGGYAEVGDYILHGLTHAVEAASGIAGAGALLLLGLVVGLSVASRSDSRRVTLPVGLGAGAVLFFAFAGISRIGLGLGQAEASRYVYIAAALLLVATAVALSQGHLRSHLARAGLFSLIALALLHNLASFQAYASARVAQVVAQHEIITAAGRLVVHGHVVAPDSAVPDPAEDPDLSLGDLRRLIADGEFHPDTGSDPGHLAYVNAAARLDVTVVPDSGERLSGSVLLEGLFGALSAPSGEGCATITSLAPGGRARINFGTAGSVRITPATSGDLTVRLATADAPDILARPAVHAVTAGQPVVVVVGFPLADPVIVLPVGANLVCGLSPTSPSTVPAQPLPL